MSLLHALGWTEELPDAPLGRVVRVDRGRAHVVADDGARAVATAGQDVCTGDWVLLGPDSINAVLPRRTVLRRAVASGESAAQALAANADAVALVDGLVPAPDLNRLERLLVLLWETGATPLVVLTKVDLVPDASAIVRSVRAAAPGVEVITVSSVSGEGIDALAPYVAPGRTLALVGRSGVGKSTLVNRLVGAEVVATQQVRAVDGKGRHTTVRRELLLVPDGGAVIDTPGVRGAGLWEVTDGVEKVFGDIEELAEQCRFPDCAHAGEPGCAVAEAISDGALDARRLASYRKLGREAEWIASRTDHRLRQERARHWKAIHKEMRQRGNRP